MKDDWLDRTSRHELELSRAETTLLHFVNANPEKVALLPQSELAAAAGVSRPVVISLGRKLHYHSHAEFRQAVSEFFSTHIDSYQASQRLQGRVETLEQLITESIQVDVRSLQRLSEVIDPATLTSFVDATFASERIWIMGPGTAHYPAHYLSQRLRRYQRPTILVGEDSTHHLDEIFPLSGNDLLILFHYTDRDDWLWPVLRFAGERGAKRMLVSATIHPRYVAECEQFIHVPRGEARFKNSMAVPMAFVNLLLLSVEIARDDLAREQLKNLESARNDWESALRDRNT